MLHIVHGGPAVVGSVPAVVASMKGCLRLGLKEGTDRWQPGSLHPPKAIPLWYVCHLRYVHLLGAGDAFAHVHYSALLLFLFSPNFFLKIKEHTVSAHVGCASTYHTTDICHAIPLHRHLPCHTIPYHIIPYHTIPYPFIDIYHAIPCPFTDIYHAILYHGVRYRR